MTPPDSSCSLVLQDISKEFHENGIKACNGISFSVFRGEILALMGENGAGKSTLMHILSGFLKPDEGSIKTGENASIGMIHQKPILAGNLTVWENIALGHRSRSFIVKPKELISRIRSIQERYSLPLDLTRKVRELSAAQIQRAEILECLLLDRTILIFDEPSASLTEQQTEEFMDLVRRFRDEGKTIIYITHKIQESYALADRIAVLRKGSLQLIRPLEEISPEAVSEAMIGSGQGIKTEKRRPAPAPAERRHPLLELKDINYREQESYRLKNLNLKLYPGEILGIAGIRENGLTFLEDLITGAIRPQTGEIRLNGRAIPFLTPFRIRRHGISYIPADRLTRGASLDATLGENLILLKRKFSGPAGSYSSKLRRWAGQLISRGGIEGHPDQQARTLSGGNIQKMILTRELHESPSLLIISEPSWGLDFSSRDRLHQRISQSRDEGAAVLLLTTDIDELLLLSDRIAVLTAGELSGTDQTEWTRKSIGERMTGADRL